MPAWGWVCAGPPPRQGEGPRRQLGASHSRSPPSSAPPTMPGGFRTQSPLSECRPPSKVCGPEPLRWGAGLTRVQVPCGPQGVPAPGGWPCGMATRAHTSRATCSPSPFPLYLRHSELSGSHCANSGLLGFCSPPPWEFCPLMSALTASLGRR